MMSDSAERATISRWLKNDGDHVTAGTPICEIETSQASVEIEADSDGILRQLLTVGSPITKDSKIATIEH
jgi:pyruvate/2-oxoglutarate dehydrogenase complex dihydrolipoamide acyltransferase (E2) component